MKDKHVYSHSKSITDADISTRKIARADARAIQNNKAIFKCLKSSICPTLKSTTFNRPGNKPTGQDGVDLFCKLTKFTTI
mmetsp:Transcript_30002/g.28898  ORF Transcript_30002/g.28898 Transcript_30002/m.28898 type:complete len:80 (+) Transcript_30002:461-700(+)